MKLNNHGWGLNEMLIYCAILLFFLILAIFSIVQLSKSLGDSLFSDLTYSMVEDNVKEATLLYIEEYYEYEIGAGTITVTTDNLLKYGVIEKSKLKPSEEKESCKGYALVKKQNNELDITSYIKCNKYVTSGYQSWRLGE